MELDEIMTLIMAYRSYWQFKSNEALKERKTLEANEYDLRSDAAKDIAEMIQVNFQVTELNSK